MTAGVEFGTGIRDWRFNVRNNFLNISTRLYNFELITLFQHLAILNNEKKGGYCLPFC